MTFEDERTQGKSHSQRIDHLAEWLEVTLGPRLVAYAVGGSPSDICRYASGQEEPAEDVTRRLRDLYTATWFIASTDGPRSAHDWLTLPNPKLDDRAPAELPPRGFTPRAAGPGGPHAGLPPPTPKLDAGARGGLLGGGGSPEPIWFSIAPAF